MANRRDDPHLQRNVDEGSDMKIDLPYLARFDDSEEQAEWTPRLNDFIRESILALQQVQRGRKRRERPCRCDPGSSRFYSLEFYQVISVIKKIQGNFYKMTQSIL